MQALIYIHGRGGSAQEAVRFRPLLPNLDVIGFDYHAETPREAVQEFPSFFDAVAETHETVSILANSIGAYYAMSSLAGKRIERALFISPIVDMEKLIMDLMVRAGVSEQELLSRREIPTTGGEILSWEYLDYVRRHPVLWNVPTHILYGSQDAITSAPVLMTFAERIGATVTIFENGEHWFHDKDQMSFLDQWLLDHLRKAGSHEE